MMIFFVKVTNISTVHIGKFPVIYMRFCEDISEHVLFVLQDVINVRVFFISVFNKGLSSRCYYLKTYITNILG